MTKTKVGVDDAETIRRFIAGMNSPVQSTSTATSPAEPSVSTQQSGGTEPASPKIHPVTSPLLTGLQAPHNTPRTVPASPRTGPRQTHDEDVGDALYNFVQGIQGLPLSESIWAPRSAKYQPSPLGGSPSKSLTTVRAVEANPAINDSFARMSFKAADSDYEVGDPLGKSPSNDDEGKGTSPSKKENVELRPKDTAVPPHLRTPDKLPRPVPKSLIEQMSESVNQLAGKKSGSEPIRPDTIENRSLPELAVDFSEAPPSSSRGGPVPQESTSATTRLPSLASPVKATSPGTTKPTEKTPAPIGEPQNLEKELYFKKWPKTEQRDRPAAKIRKVIIKNLPCGSGPSFVASLVYGGPLEQIYMRNETSASVLFLNAADCQKFYDDTSNGLVYRKDNLGRELVVFVELAKDVDVIGGRLQGWINVGITRSVRVVCVGEDSDIEVLRKVTSRKNWTVETVDFILGHRGSWSAIFHFCKIADAVEFKLAISRDEEWEHCNIHFASDPCADATGVHLPLEPTPDTIDSD